MSLFRRRRGAADETEGTDGTAGADSTAATDDAGAQDTATGDAGGAGQEPARAGLSLRPQGPFDVTEVDDAVSRVDLGALQLPGVTGMELRLEVEDGTRRVVAATVALSGSSVQLQVFAAPRTRGIWDEVREEIAASLVTAGGSTSEQPGPYGTELVASVPARSPDGRTGTSPARFVGIDGPRWFLRAVFSGPAALDSEAAAPLEGLLRAAVVVRGAEAMAPRDLLALRLPRVPEGAGAPPGDAAGAPSDQAGQPVAPAARGTRGPVV